MQRRLLVLILFLSTACRGVRDRRTRRVVPTVRRTSVVLNGCRVDPARICNNIRGQSCRHEQHRLAGRSADGRAEFGAHRQRLRPGKKPNGDEIFEVECGINTLNQSVSWAHVKTGPPVTDDDVKYPARERLLFGAVSNTSCDTSSSQILAAVAILLLGSPRGAIAQQTATPGVPPDFAASANARVNYYRAMAKLPPIVDDSAISAGALNHARYLVKNGIAGGDMVLDKQTTPFSNAARRFPMGGQRQAVLHRQRRFGGQERGDSDRAGDQLERRRIRRPPDDDAVQRADSDGAAILDRWTRRVLRPGPVRDCDSVSLRAGEIRAHRALRRTSERSTLESEPRTHSDGRQDG